MKVVLDGASMTLADVYAVARGARVELAASALEAMTRSREFVDNLVQEKKPVYGITTGFGRFSDVAIQAEDVATLQQNLLRSHACGVGEYLPEAETRVLMALRANALALGHSGIRPQVVQMLLDRLTSNVRPHPSQVLWRQRRSGPLAHMLLMGEGQARWHGQIRPPARPCQVRPQACDPGCQRRPGFGQRHQFMAAWDVLFCHA